MFRRSAWLLLLSTGIALACVACNDASKPEETAAEPLGQRSVQRSYSIACPPTWRAEVEPPDPDPMLDQQRIRCVRPGTDGEHTCEAQREMGDLGTDVQGYRAWVLAALTRGAESSRGKVVTDRVRQLTIDGRPAIRDVERVVSDALSPWSVVYFVVNGETFLRLRCWTKESTVDHELAELDELAGSIRFK